MKRSLNFTLRLACALSALALAASSASAASSSASSPASASATSSATSSAKRPVLLSGEVLALDSQVILVPPSDSWPVVLRYFVPEGTSVKAGDVVLRIELQGVASLDKLKTDMAQVQARAEREGAELEVKAIEAEKNLVLARAALAKAEVDATLPKDRITALDFDRNQGEKERALRDLEVKQQALANAREAVRRRADDGALELKKLQINLAYARTRLSEAEVRAKQDGVVVHDFSLRRGERYEEGSGAVPGTKVGQVMGSGKMQVRAWALEADRPFIKEGQTVRLGFDAMPGKSLLARISHIANAPEARAVWGQGRYFQLDVTLPPNHDMQLVPGMSVQLEPQADSARAAPQPGAAATAAAAVATSALQNIEGEIESHSVTPVLPPTIAEVWKYTLAQVAAEGSLVKPGQTLAVFQTEEVLQRISSQSSTLKERQRALDKLKLDQAEAARSADLAVAEAQSNADKAARKAKMPKELVRRVDYDKFVIERDQFAELAKLALRQREAQTRARKAELAGLVSEIAQLQASIDLLKAGEKSLTVSAKRAGMVLSRSSFGGEKYAAGSEVWQGSSVATLADPQQLFVKAKVPEAQSGALRLGQRANIRVPGANLTLAGRVSALGRVFHSKSGSQPLIVRDIEIELDSQPTGVKPGAAVQLSLADVLPAGGK